MKKRLTGKDICKLMKGSRAVKCYNKRGELIGVWTVKRRR